LKLLKWYDPKMPDRANLPQPSCKTIAFRIALADRYIRTLASFFFNDAAHNYLTGLPSPAR
jgi:hypothetical protein